MAGTDEQTQMATDAGILKVLGQVQKHLKSSIQKLAEAPKVLLPEAGCQDHEQCGRWAQAPRPAAGFV